MLDLYARLFLTTQSFAPFTHLSTVKTFIPCKSPESDDYLQIKDSGKTSLSELLYFLLLFLTYDAHDALNL